jgi:hypothetical protein
MGKWREETLMITKKPPDHFPQDYGLPQ